MALRLADAPSIRDYADLEPGEVFLDTDDDVCLKLCDGGFVVLIPGDSGNGVTAGHTYGKALGTVKRRYPYAVLILEPEAM